MFSCFSADSNLNSARITLCPAQGYAYCRPLSSRRGDVAARNNRSGGTVSHSDINVSGVYQEARVKGKRSGMRLAVCALSCVAAISIFRDGRCVIGFQGRIRQLALYSDCEHLRRQDADGGLEAGANR